MTITLLIGTILFGLTELSKITLFKDLVGKIIEAKIALSIDYYQKFQF